MEKENIESMSLSSLDDFEEYCLLAYRRFYQGDLFPYSLKETYHFVYSSWEEAEKEVMENGIEGFSYQRSDDGDYLLCMHGFTVHLLMKDKTGELVSRYCNTTCESIVTTFDLPHRYETKVVKGVDGRVKIVHVPINGYQPKTDDPRYSGIMEANGDLAVRIRFGRFLQNAEYTWSTAEIAEPFGMPEEGLLCVLEQHGMIEMDDENWKMTDGFADKDFVLEKVGMDGKPELQWTFQGFFYIYLLLTKDCKVTPCCERK